MRLLGLNQAIQIKLYPVANKENKQNSREETEFSQAHVEGAAVPCFLDKLLV